MKNNSKNKLMIIAAVVIFISPVILSWWFLNYTNVVTEGGKSNYGDLIDPPRPIADMMLYDPIAEKDYRLHGKWSMIYLADTCDEACLNNLYRMRQLHIAMDKHSLRVQRVLLLNETGLDLKTLFAEYAGQRILEPGSAEMTQLRTVFRLSEAEDPFSANRLYIIDPLGNLMMSYPPDINPRGIMLDLKKLLKHSRIG